MQVAPTLQSGGNRTGGDRPPGTDVDTSDTLIPIAFSCKDHGADADTGVAPTIRAMGHAASHQNAGDQLAIAFAQNQRNEIRTLEAAGALAADPGMKQQTFLALPWAVRRLTSAECERLQGFPDDCQSVSKRAPYRRPKVTPVAHG